MNSEKPPFCKKCKNEPVQADAGLMKSIPYWYCRSCKEELDSYGFFLKDRSKYSELDDYLDEQLARLNDESPAQVKTSPYSFVDPDDKDDYPWYRRK